MSDLPGRSLPKWSQMLTSGAPVTPGQAREIIRRTDSFLAWGYADDDDRFPDLTRRLRMPRMPRDRDPGVDAGCDQERWREAWGIIGMKYVQNDWIDSAYILGPHGWCWPDGRIFYEENVGKWPSVEEVARDWAALSVAFPFLDLAATLMSGQVGQSEEIGENATAPIVTILVRDGRVDLAEGDLGHHARFPALHRRTEDDAMRVYACRDGERGLIPEAWLDEWEALAREIFP